MSRRKTNRLPIQFRIRENLIARLNLLLYSPTEGRVPYGAQSDLIEGLLDDFFARYDRSKPTTPLGDSNKPTTPLGDSK